MDEYKKFSVLAKFVNYKGQMNAWNPKTDPEQNHKCETILIKRGKYPSSITNYALSDLVNPNSNNENYPNITLVKYHGSKTALGVNGKGKDRLEAVCDACINFHELTLTESLMKDL